MKAYLVTTGTLFGLLAAVHVWRAIEEWPHSTVSPAFVLEMGALVALPGALSWWAWRVLRNLSNDRARRGDEKGQRMDSDDPAG